MKQINFLTLQQTLEKMGDGEWVRVEDVVELLKNDSPFFVELNSFQSQLQVMKPEALKEWLTKRMKRQKA